MQGACGSMDMDSMGGMDMMTQSASSMMSSKPRKKKRLGVIGAGTAGILTLIHFCTWLEDDWEIYSIYNPHKQILGIGESTNGEFVGLLERGIRFCLGHQEDLDALDATLKFGSRFQNWRPNSWLNPLLDGNIALHFNNYNFKNLAFGRLEKLWPRQFRFIEGDVKGMVNHADRVTVTIDDQEHEFDFVVDCMGTPTCFKEYVMSDCSPVNRCQIHSITDFEYDAWTDHIAHPHGWMFGVPLQSRKTFGYMYNDTITSKEEAIMNMKEILGVDEIENKEYLLKCYYAKEMAQGRVCKNGNKALFFEPLVANSIFVYLYTNRLIYDYIMGNTDAARTNDSFVKAVQSMEDVISYYYQGGSIYESKFWDYATVHTRERLKNRPAFKEIMAMYRNLKDRGILHTAPTYGLKPLTWEIVDEQMGYGYLDGMPDMDQYMDQSLWTGEFEERLRA